MSSLFNRSFRCKIPVILVSVWMLILPLVLCYTRNVQLISTEKKLVRKVCLA